MSLEELLKDLNSRLIASGLTGFWDNDTKKRWLNLAIQRICSFEKWEFTEEHAYRSTVKDQEKYSMPSDCPPQGINYLKVDDKEYKYVDLVTFLRCRDNKEDVKIFTDKDGELLIYPTIPEDGKKIELWYQRIPPALVNDSDTPITPPNLDEAIVRIALASALRKSGKGDEANMEIAEATTIMQQVLDRTQDGKLGYEGKAINSRWL